MIKQRESTVFKVSFAVLVVALLVLAVCQETRAQAKQCIVVAPIAVNGFGWDTGLTIVNLSDTEDLVVSRIEYIDATDITTRRDVSFGYQTRIPPGRRWTRMLSEVMTGVLDGSLRIHIVTTKNTKYLAWSSIIDPAKFTNMIAAPEFTCRLIQ